MILIVSTSASVSSIAWVNNGRLAYQASREAARSSSQAIVEMVVESGIALSEAKGFVADLGPGSLTGVKVGVTLVKTWGFALGVKVSGISAFDLVSTNEPVVISARRGEYFVRLPGQSPRVLSSDDLSQAGLEFDVNNKPIPLASRGIDLTNALSWVEPELLVPLYLSAPLVSTAKKPLSLLESKTT